jgi:hypothetical protein
MRVAFLQLPRPVYSPFNVILTALVTVGCSGDFTTSVPLRLHQAGYQPASQALFISAPESVSSYEKIFGESEPAAVIVNDPLFPLQWYFRNLGQEVPPSGSGTIGADIAIPSPWPNHVTGDRVLLALIDSGFDVAHPDIDLDRLHVNSGELGLDSSGRDKAKNGLDDDGNGFIDDVSGWSFADDSPFQADSLGHGTHLAGLLIAKRDNELGIAVPWSGFNLLPLQIFSGKRPSVPVEKIADAIRYAVDNGAKVISASFGTPTHSDHLLSALRYALEHDVLVVSATGNFRKNLQNEPSFPASYRLPNLISVSASGNTDLASLFTNFGPEVDIFAPGESIVSTSLRSAYATRSGTSQACPLVAAVAAELRFRFPSFTAAEIKKRIVDAGDQLQGLVGFSKNGVRLNYRNALSGHSGIRLDATPEHELRRLSYQLESEHPYRAGHQSVMRVILPDGVRSFRLKFEKFSTQSTDVLYIRDQSGRIVQQLSGELGDFRTAFISGAEATLEFRTDAFVSDWGWRISHVELIGP